MALSGWSTANYTRVASGLATATPFSCAAWVYLTANALSGDVLFLGASGSTGNSNIFRLLAGANAVALTNGNLATGSAISLNTWTHIAGVWASATSRSIYVNGGGKVTNTTSATPSGVDRTTIGKRDNASNDGGLAGNIAEWGFWNAALDDAEVASLAAGAPPLNVRPTSLLAYLPMVRDFIDLKGAGFSITGSLSAADHCRIYGRAA